MFTIAKKAMVSPASALDLIAGKDEALWKELRGKEHKEPLSNY